MASFAEERWIGSPLSELDKGGPGHSGDIPFGEIATQGWNLLNEDLPLPLAVLKIDALRRNSAWMREFLALSGAKIAPHGKTSMAPALFDLQLRDGAWAITVSTPHQIRVARRHGYDRIFLANQLVGRSAIEYVYRELEKAPEFEFYCLADSIQVVEALSAVGDRIGAARPLNLLVEVGFEGGRTGCRTDADALAVARAIAASPNVSLCGVEGFEGIIWRHDPEERIQKVDAFLARVVSVAEICCEERLFESSEIILTAGGSSFFDLVVQRLGQAKLDRPTAIITRSGCYLTLDAHMYQIAFERLRKRAPDLFDRLGNVEPALEVWAYVQSRPEDGLAIAGLGKRDISYDHMPIPLAWFRPGGDAKHPTLLTDGHVVFRLDDQHIYLKIDRESPIAVGDMISFGVSHPCLTFDKWRVMHYVDESYNIVGSIRTFF